MLKYGICCCRVCEVKHGGPSIEPDPILHPQCPNSGDVFKVVNGLLELRREIMAYTIEKCLWWPRHYAVNPMGTKASRAIGEEITVHLEAAKSRVEDGRPFDSYSETCDA